MSSELPFFPASAHVKYKKKRDAQLASFVGPDVVNLRMQGEEKKSTSQKYFLPGVQEKYESKCAGPSYRKQLEKCNNLSPSARD